jgi:MFS family permease
VVRFHSLAPFAHSFAPELSVNEAGHSGTARTASRWLNSTVLGIGLASLFEDWSHEIASTVLPAFLATMGAAAAWLGLIEGISDGLSSFAKMGSGYYTDKLQRRKPIAVIGYLVTVLGTASIGLATAALHFILAWRALPRAQGAAGRLGDEGKLRPRLRL